MDDNFRTLFAVDIKDSENTNISFPVPESLKPFSLSTDYIMLKNKAEKENFDNPQHEKRIHINLLPTFLKSTKKSDLYLFKKQEY